LGLSPGGLVGDGLDSVSLIIGSLGDDPIGIGDGSGVPIRIVVREFGPLAQGIDNGLELAPVVSLIRSVWIVFKGGDV